MTHLIDPFVWLLGAAVIAGIAAAYAAFVQAAFWALDRALDWIDRRTR